MTRTALLLIAAFTLLVVAVVIALYPSQTTSADSIIETCKNHPQGRETCYEKEVPKLYPDESIPELMTLIREIRSKDPSYQFCHVLAHKLGEAVVAEDPDGWLDAIPLNPSDGLCSNGFIHGVIVGRFRNDVLDDETLQKNIPAFQEACEPRANWNASRLDQAICYHGMGHLFMFITNADIPRALATCDAVGMSPTGDFLRVCREGVFMQIYQPLEPDDFALVELLPEKPTKENYRRLCAAYDTAAEGACLREAWPLFRAEITSGTGMEAFCARQPASEETEACYQTGAAIVGRLALGDGEKAVAACNRFPSSWQTLCFVSVAQAVVEEDRTRGADAIELCKRASSPVDRHCMTELASRASFIFAPGSSDGRQFCEAFPPDLRETCRI